MKRWTPYIVASVIGLGLAVAAFPTRSGKDGASARARVEARAAKKAASTKENAAAGAPSVATVSETVAGSEPAAPAAEPASGEPAVEPVAEPVAAPEPAGPSREELFGKHVAQTAPYWAQVAKELGGTNEKLSLDAAATARFMRDQARVDDPEVGYALEKEGKMIERIRAQSTEPRVVSVLDYLAASGRATERGEDPGALPRPKQDRPAP